MICDFFRIFFIGIKEEKKIRFLNRFIYTIFLPILIFFLPTAQTSNHTLSPDAKEFIPRSKPQTDAQMPQQLPHQNHGGQYADYRNSPQAPSHRGSGLHDRLLMQQFPNNGAHHQHQQYEYSRSNASSNSHHHHSNHHSVQNRLKNTNNQNYQNSTNNANSESSQANQMVSVQTSWPVKVQQFKNDSTPSRQMRRASLWLTSRKL